MLPSPILYLPLPLHPSLPIVARRSAPLFYGGAGSLFFVRSDHPPESLWEFPGLRGHADQLIRNIQQPHLPDHRRVNDDPPPSLLLGVGAVQGPLERRGHTRDQAPSQAGAAVREEANAFPKQLVAGTEVRLEFDPQRRDKYRRLMAYVYIGEQMLNAELVRQGYAQVTTFPPNVKYQELFLSLQREAREAKRGLWKEK